VHINPLHREKLPRTAMEVMSRINEISFNSSLMREMRAISFVTRLIDEGKVNGDELKRLYVHGISMLRSASSGRDLKGVLPP
jgi:NTE family protein